MPEIGSRQRNLPAPPHVVFEDLTAPTSRWLRLHDDEVAPTVLESREPAYLVWSSPWPRRPDARVAFAVSPDGADGTDVRWTLTVDEPTPDEGLTGHLRKRINTLIFADLRYSYGQ